MTPTELKQIIDNFEAWFNGPEAQAILTKLGEQMRTLDSLDDQISTSLRIVEDNLRERGIQRVYSITIDDETELGWSASRGKWRLVQRDKVDGAITPALSLARDERCELLNGPLQKLLDKINHEESLQRRRYR